jgi:hypothetical protein
MNKKEEAKYLERMKKGMKARDAKRAEERKKKETNEGKVMSSYKVVMEGQSFSVQNVHLAKILRRFPHELAVFRMEGDLDDHLYEALFDHYFDEGEMPYGTAKARDGDPYEWVSDRLAKEIGGGGSSVGHPADKADYMGMGESEVDEAMNPFQQQRASALSKSKDDAWAKAKAAVDAGGTVNPFKAKTPAEHNPAFTGGERAGQARAGAGAWSGNFEGVGEGAAGDVMEGDREVDLSTVELDGVNSWDHPDYADAYATYAEYTDGTPLTDDELEQFTNDNGDFINQKANDSAFGESIGEDSVAPEVEPGEELITEGMESIVTDVLTSVGLDHGLDFFFDNGLTVIGASESNVAVNALKADHRITSTPVRQHMGGQEYKIEFSKPSMEAAPAPAMAPAMESKKKKSTGKKLNEDVNLNITADGQDDVVNVIRRLSGLGADSVEADMSPLSITTAEPVQSVGASSDMSSMIGALDAIDGQGDVEPEDDVQADIVSHSGGAANDDLDETEYDNQPDPEVYATTQQQMNFGDKSQQGRRQPMTQPGNNPMAESRRLMREYESMIHGVKAK